MKCKSCGFEWIEKDSSQRLEKCPICGSAVVRNNEAKESTASGVIKEIIRKYGINILSEKERFIGLFGDYAPKMTHEKRILQHSFDENIVKYFIRCNESDRQGNIEKAHKTLLEVLNEKTTKEILELFVSVFGWNVKIPETVQQPVYQPVQQNIKPAPKPIQPAPVPQTPKLIYNINDAINFANKSFDQYVHKPVPPAPKSVPPVPPTAKPIPPVQQNTKPAPPVPKPIQPEPSAPLSREELKARLKQEKINKQFLKKRGL